MGENKARAIGINHVALEVAGTRPAQWEWIFDQRTAAETVEVMPDSDSINASLGCCRAPLWPWEGVQ